MNAATLLAGRDNYKRSFCYSYLGLVLSTSDSQMESYCYCSKGYDDDAAWVRSWCGERCQSSSVKANKPVVL